jgi:predicted MarR family transcription regulator
MRKLTAEGLIEKQGSSRTGVTCQGTEKGKAITDTHREIRKQLLKDRISSLQGYTKRLPVST